MTQLEIKTTEQIVEQRRILISIADNNLVRNANKDFKSDLLNKEWISKESLIIKLKELKLNPFKFENPQSDYIIRVNHFIDKFIEKELEKK